MEIKHEENLCTAIFRRLNKIGFNEENVENEYIHLNFIMYFLKNVSFNRHIFQKKIMN